MSLRIPRGERRWAFALGDYAAGLVLSIATAAAIHAMVRPGWDMVIAMLLGMGVGTGLHVLVALLFGPWVGMLPVMATGSLIGMYGGMLFGMRDSMQACSWSHVVGVAALFGCFIVWVIRTYDQSLRGTRASGSSERLSS